MEGIEYNFWCIKIETAEIEQQAASSKRDYWKLKLEMAERYKRSGFLID